MFKRILVATDGSAHARKAVELAGDLAGRYGADLLVLHAVVRTKIPDELRHMAEVEHIVERRVPVTGPSATAPAPVVDRDLGDQRLRFELGQRFVEQAESAARTAGAPAVRTVVEEGDPVSWIIDWAKREESDLIVTGSRGMSDFKGLLLGSVSHKVAQLAPCTVITVR